MEREVSKHAPASLYRGERTHRIGGWVGPRAGLDTEATGKIILPLPAIELLSPGRPDTTLTELPRIAVRKNALLRKRTDIPLHVEPYLQLIPLLQSFVVSVPTHSTFSLVDFSVCVRAPNNTCALGRKGDYRNLSLVINNILRYSNEAKMSFWVAPSF
jgi:hypothetical protein